MYPICSCPYALTLAFYLSAAEAEPTARRTLRACQNDFPQQNLLLLGWVTHEIDVDIDLVLVCVVLLR